MIDTESIIPGGNKNYSDEPFVKPASTSEVLGAQAALSFMGTPLQSAIRGVTNFIAGDVPEDQLLQPDQIKKQFGFDSQVPLSEAKARNIFETNETRAQAQSVIDRGRGGFLEESGKLALGFAYEIFDPINYVSGMGIASLTSKLAARGILGATSKALVGTGRKTLGVNIAEAVTGNLAVDLGIIYPQSKQEQSDLDIEDTILMSVGAGIIFPSALAGISRLGKLGFKNIEAYAQDIGDRMDTDKKPRMLPLEEEKITRFRSKEIDDEIQKLAKEQEVDLELRQNSIDDPELENRLAQREARFQELSQEKQKLNTDLEKDVDIRKQVNAETEAIGYNDFERNEALKFMDEPEDTVSYKDKAKNLLDEEIKAAQDPETKLTFEEGKAKFETKLNEDLEVISAFEMCTAGVIDGI